MECFCPKCHVPLTTVKSSAGVFLRCDSCNGRSATLSLLRRSIPANVLNELWQSSKSGTFPQSCTCPACPNRMVEVSASTERGKQYLDVCTICQCVWFDYSAVMEESRFSPPFFFTVVCSIWLAMFTS